MKHGKVDMNELVIGSGELAEGDVWIKVRTRMFLNRGDEVPGLWDAGDDGLCFRLKDRHDPHYPSQCCLGLEWSTRDDGKWGARTAQKRNIKLPLDPMEIERLIETAKSQGTLKRAQSFLITNDPPRTLCDLRVSIPFSTAPPVSIPPTSGMDKSA